MDSTRHLHRSPSDWLLESEIAPYVDAFTHHLGERRYAAQTVCTYQRCLAHFARWASGRRQCVRQIDEDVIRLTYVPA